MDLLSILSLLGATSWGVDGRVGRASMEVPRVYPPCTSVLRFWHIERL